MRVRSISGGVADLEAHPELLGAVVEEEDGEDAVVDDGADEVGDAVHEGVEVERGVEGVGEGVEEVDLVQGSTRIFAGCGGGFFGARAGSLPRRLCGWVSFGSCGAGEAEAWRR